MMFSAQEARGAAGSNRGRWQLLIVAWLALAAFASSSLPAHALGDVCNANDVQFVDTAGRLIITDYAIMQRKLSCPTTADDLGTSFPADLDQDIHLWFRLEGDNALLDRIGPKSRFTATIRRWNAQHRSGSSLKLDRHRIWVDAARGETAISKGHFDWRFRSQIRSYLVPGQYELRLFFNNRRLCTASGVCQINFTVVESDGSR